MSGLKKGVLLCGLLAILAGCGDKVMAPAPVEALKMEEPAPAVMEETIGPPHIQAAAAESPAFQSKAHVTYSGAGGGKSKEAALTFDDGPDAKYTLQILDILKKHDITATFFVVGDHAASHPEVMKRIVQEGHQIGNHSWDHADLTKLEAGKLKDEVEKTDALIAGYTGSPPSLFRPPYGALSAQVADEVEKTGHRIVNWSVDTRDWEGASSASILAAVKKEIKPGAIILQHSAGGKHGKLTNTVEALPQMITYLKAQGYKLVTVDQLLRDSA